MNRVFIYPVHRVPRSEICILTSCFQNIVEINPVLVHYLWKMYCSEEAFSLFPFRYCAGCWISEILRVMWISLTTTEKWKKWHGIWHGCIENFVHYAWVLVVNSSLWSCRNGVTYDKFSVPFIFHNYKCFHEKCYLYLEKSLCLYHHG